VSENKSVFNWTFLAVSLLTEKLNHMKLSYEENYVL
jgi:hypothetical protein